MEWKVKGLAMKIGKGGISEDLHMIIIVVVVVVLLGGTITRGLWLHSAFRPCPVHLHMVEEFI